MFDAQATLAGWDGLNIGPAPTAAPEPPAWLGMRNLIIRQTSASASGAASDSVEASATLSASVSTATCAWFSYKQEEKWEALACEGGCTTSGSLFGCSNLPRTCQDNTQAICSGASSAVATCCDENFPFCVTGIMTEGSNTYTAYRCGKNYLSGETPLYDDTTKPATKTDEDGKTTVFITTGDPDTATDTTDQGTVPPKATSTGDNDKDDGGSGGSSTPIGAIVGGVIGGVALILIIAFGIWFIRFQKRKAAKRAADANASTEPYRQQDMGSPYQGSAPVAGYGYQPSNSPGYAQSTVTSGYAQTYNGSSPPPPHDMQYAQPHGVVAEAPDQHYAKEAVELPTQYK